MAAAITELRKAAQPQGVPVVLMELVENKIYGGMHIAKWDNPGGLKEGSHKLYAEQPAPVALALPERREIGPNYPYLSDLDIEWNACLDEVKRLNR